MRIRMKTMSERKKRLVVGVSGASGALLARDLLQQIKELPDWETHVVITGSAERTLRHEIPDEPNCLDSLSDFLYEPGDIGARIASGSFATEGMVVVPCSTKTAAGINSGYSDNLLLRAADVTIKERRPLVLCIREAPLSPIHLRNMLELSRIGVTILPPMMSFYSRPDSIAQMVRHNTGKILHIFGEEADGYQRWTGDCSTER